MRRAPAGLVALGLLGCPPEPVTPSEAYTPDWDGVQAMFTDHCDACHTGNPPELRPLVLGDLEAEAGLYVVPGDSEGSFLWEAIAGTTLSAMMPPTGRLPLHTVDPIRQWIDDGASAP